MYKNDDVTGIPPEEVMAGRKIRRGLPLIRRGKATFNDNVLDARDRKSKTKAKAREDARRGARQCRIKPGDTVVVERQTRGKGESRFDSRKYTVTEERNGMLVLSDESGQILKRHVSQTKRVHHWRSSDSDLCKRSDSGTSDQNSSAHPPQGDNLQPSLGERPNRARRAPEYLRNYVRVVESDPTMYHAELK